jgi:rhodanese-related sulfurtransferase
MADLEEFGDPAELKRLIDEQERPYYLVDVRSAEEVAEGVIPTARHIPLYLIGVQPPTDDRDALIVLYCHSGGRSAFAKRELESRGYRNVENFGGVIHWPYDLVELESDNG